MRRSARTWISAVASILVVTACTWIVVVIHAAPQRDADRGAVAGEWQGYLAPVGIAIPLLLGIFAWWRRGWRPKLDDDPVHAAEALDRAADRLARQTLSRWQREAHERGLTKVAPIAVTWVWNHKRSLPVEELFEPHAAPAASRRPVHTLHGDVWTQLLHHRLVVLGEPGAGKSGTLIMLLLRSLESRRAIGSVEERSRVPVPVLVTMGGWRPGTQPLADYVAEALTRDCPALLSFGRDAALRLVEEERIELLLDGLDELPPAVQGEALACIDKETPGLRLVLASRTPDYVKASADGQLAHAAVIELLPVASTAATAYLTQGHASPEVRDRWQRFTATVAARPGSAVAKALRSPLTLTLARTTYSGSYLDGLHELVTLPHVRDVKAAVIGAFLTVAYPDVAERQHALHWLGLTSRQLGANRDVRWWDIPRWVPETQFRLAARWLLGIAGALVLAVGLAVAGEHKLRFRVDSHLLSGLTSAILLGAVVGAMLGQTFTSSLLRQRSLSKQGPRFATVRWPRGRDLRAMLLSGGAGAVLLVALDQVVILITGHIAGLGVGVAVVVGFGVGAIVRLTVLWTSPSEDLAAVTPLTAYRSDLIASTFKPIALGLAVGIALGVRAMSQVPGREALLRGVVTGLLTMLLLWLAGSIVSAVKLTEMILRITHRRRVRFLRLFEDAVSRQVLRQVGAVYQFRHAELQDHLAALSEQGAERPFRNTGTKAIAKQR